MPSSQPNPDPVIVHIFIALQLTGGIGMTLILLTSLLSRSIKKRNMTWYNFCISWIISCTSYCLLFFAGQQTVFDKEKPSYGLCLTQAALIYSGPPMTGATTFALFFDVYSKIHEAMTSSSTRSSRSQKLPLRITPYILWIILTISYLIYGRLFPETVQRDDANTYCVLKSTVPPILTSALVVIASLMVLIILGLIIHRLHKAREDQSAMGFRGDPYLKSFILRLLVFAVMGLVAICVGIVYTFSRAPAPSYDLAMAALPVGGSIVFGTQQDIMDEWIKIFQKIVNCLFCRFIPSNETVTNESRIALRKYAQAPPELE